jgi:hypothetical protein
MSDTNTGVVSSRKINALGRSVTIRVAIADALGATVDALALKFAQAT